MKKKDGFVHGSGSVDELAMFFFQLRRMPLEALEVVRWRADALWVRVMIMVMMTMGRLLRTTSDRCRTSAIPVYSPPVVQRKGDLCGCNYCIRVQCNLTWKQGDSVRGEGGCKDGMEDGRRDERKNRPN